MKKQLQQNTSLNCDWGPRPDNLGQKGVNPAHL